MTAKHEKAAFPAYGSKKNGTRATSVVSMTDKHKAYFTEKAQEHGLSL